jgi:hypothetical protein
MNAWVDDVSLDLIELFVFGMMNQEGGAFEQRHEGQEEDGDIHVPLDRDPAAGDKNDQDWPGKDFGFTADEFDGICEWRKNSKGFAGQIQDEHARTRLLYDVSCDDVEPVAFAGYLLSMGVNMERVADAFLRDPEGGKFVREAVADKCAQYQRALEQQAESKRAKSAAPLGGVCSALPAVGFNRKVVPGEQPYDEDMAGTRTRVDLLDLDHVLPAVPNSAEDRRRVRERDLNHVKTKEILTMYYSGVEKTTRFNPDTLTKMKSRAGNALLMGAAVPLPRNVTPGAVVEEVKHEFLVGQRHLTQADRAKDAQMRDQQKMVRNIVFRFQAPLHCKLGLAADACSNDELVAAALAAYAEEEELVSETISRISKRQLLENLLGCFRDTLCELADDCGLVLHALCAKDITLQKESLILNEEGERAAVQELYADLPRAKQTATVSVEKRRLLEAGAQNSAMMAVAVKAAMDQGRKRKDHEHRTPSSGRKAYNNARGYGVPHAPRKTFRQPDWNQQRGSAAGAGATAERGETRPQPYHPPYQGRGGRGAGRARGSNAGGRGRAASQRGGLPVRR